MELLLDALPITIYLLGVVVEHAWPARPYPVVPRWRSTCVAFSLVGGVVAIAVGAGMSAIIGNASLVDGGALGGWGIAVGVLSLSLCYYLLHRFVLHRFDAWFRWVHQLHHSAERIDVWGANFGHPFQIVLQGAIVATLMQLTFGFTHDIVAYVAAIAVFTNTFQHLNVRTPRWVGFLVQRPEAHNIHHQRGVHAWNYSDLPLWDIVFGTYRNPRTSAVVEVGYHDEASRRIAAMLVGRDVTTVAG